MLNRVIGPVLLASLLVSTVAAAERKLEYLVEAGNGISIPVGGDNYKRVADPSYKASLRFALDIPIVAGLRLGPYVQLDGVPINSDDATFENNAADARFGRIRFLVGPDIRYRVIERLDLWLRLGVGVDYVSGNVTSKILAMLSQGYSSTVFGFEPSVGATVRVYRMLVVGGSIGFPFAVNHRFGNFPQFNAADVDIMFTFGVRLPPSASPQ
jgi:hypothetical protein